VCMHAFLSKYICICMNACCPRRINASSIHAEGTVTCATGCSKPMLMRGEHANTPHAILLKHRDNWQTADP